MTSSAFFMRKTVPKLRRKCSTRKLANCYTTIKKGRCTSMPYSPYIPTMGGYNPMNTYMQPPAMPQTPQPLMQSGIVCRLVASKEEAATTQIPFDGNPYVFPNLSAGEIYVKQFNINTGNTDFSTYTRYVPEPITYATADDIAALRAEIEALGKKNGKKKAEVTEDDE